MGYELASFITGEKMNCFVIVAKLDRIGAFNRAKKAV
jgi:hypothetical protein